MESDTRNLQCSICGKTFLTHDSLYNHTRRNHLKNSFKCFHCSYQTNFKFVLGRHMIKKHFLEERSNDKPSRLLCPLCSSFRSCSRNVMLEHYEAIHDVKMNETVLHFNSNEEFLSWKQDMEVRDSCLYSSHRGKRKSHSGTVKYLRCSRDGFYRPSGKGLRRMKGSFKIDAVCPSSIKLEQMVNSGQCKVTFVSTHVGHACDEGRLFLSTLGGNSVISESASKSKCRGKLTPEITRIRRRHKRSLTMEPIIQPAQDGWLVSSKNKKDIYEVKKMDVTCDCVTKCAECDICIHDYCCTCRDSMKLNLCCHIHCVVNHLKQKTPYQPVSCIPQELGTENLVMSPDRQDEIETAFVEELPSENALLNPQVDLEEKKHHLRTFFMNIVDSIQTMEDYDLVNAAIMHLPHVLQLQNAGLLFSTNSAVDKNISNVNVLPHNTGLFPT